MELFEYAFKFWIAPKAVAYSQPWKLFAEPHTLRDSWVGVQQL